MRSVLACAIAFSAALLSGGLEAAAASEPASKVALQSSEGQAILKQVEAVTRRINFMSRPMVIRSPVIYPTGDLDRQALSQGFPLEGTTTTTAISSGAGGGWPGSSRNRIVPDQVPVATGARARLMAERAALLDKLDMGPLTRAMFDGR